MADGRRQQVLGLPDGVRGSHDWWDCCVPAQPTGADSRRPVFRVCWDEQRSPGSYAPPAVTQERGAVSGATVLLRFSRHGFPSASGPVQTARQLR
jgi:hypothetical protein